MKRVLMGMVLAGLLNIAVYVFGPTILSWWFGRGDLPEYRFIASPRTISWNDIQPYTRTP